MIPKRILNDHTRESHVQKILFKKKFIDNCLSLSNKSQLVVMLRVYYYPTSLSRSVNHAPGSLHVISSGL